MSAPEPHRHANCRSTLVDIAPAGKMSIKGWPGYYAGNDGRIYSGHRGKLRRVAEWEAGRPRCRYRKVTLYRTRCTRRGNRAEKRNFGVHTLVASAFIGRRPRPTSEAAHVDGNRRNNRPDNLAWKTRRQNERDKVAHGTAPRGENNGRSKISAIAAVAIRSLRAPVAEVAAFYGISASQVRRIRAGAAWADPMTRARKNRTHKAKSIA